MIQFNLLPDVKLEYVRTQRIKRTVMTAAFIATAASFAIFALLFAGVHLVQKKIITNQTADIKTYSTQLRNTPDLTKILTIQNQLSALSGLHASKPAADRTFGLLQQVTPTGMSLTSSTTDFVANTVELSGIAPNLDKVNTMIDTMKYATYGNSATSSQKVFSGVVLSTFTRNSTTSTFTITASYDPVIYNNAQNVTFTVPAGISSQSVAGQPGAQLFVKPTNTNSNGN